MLSFYYSSNSSLSLKFLEKDFIYLLLKGKGGRKRGREHQCVVASCMPPTGELASNLGMCPDWESNRRSLGSWADTQSTEPQHPGLIENFQNYRGKATSPQNKLGSILLTKAAEIIIFWTKMTTTVYVETVIQSLVKHRHNNKWNDSLWIVKEAIKIHREESDLKEKSFLLLDRTFWLWKTPLWISPTGFDM